MILDCCRAVLCATYPTVGTFPFPAACSRAAVACLPRIRRFGTADLQFVTRALRLQFWLLTGLLGLDRQTYVPDELVPCPGFTRQPLLSGYPAAARDTLSPLLATALPPRAEQRRLPAAGGWLPHLVPLIRYRLNV